MDRTFPVRALVSLLISFGAGAVHAIPLLTTAAETSVNSGTTSSAAYNSVGGQISSTATDSSAGASATGAASSTGALAASAGYLSARGIPSIGASAAVSWSETYVAETAAFYAFDFVMPSARLRIEDYGIGNPLSASFAVSVLLNGAELFASSAELIGTAAASSLITGGADLANSAFGGGNVFGFDFDEFAGSLDLGIFDAGESLTLTYLISVASSGPGTESGASASIGDPFNFDNSLGIDLSFTPLPTQVSAPGTLLLLIAGFIGLGLSRSHSRKSCD